MNSGRPLGPWTVTCARDRAGAYNNIGAPDSDERDVALVSCDHPHYREIQALIVAAPELLEALRDLADLVKDGYQHNDIAMTRSLGQARAALAKAGCIE